MAIKFKTLHVENFMLLASADVTFQSGLTLVEGLNKDSAGASSNYSGKSSLLESIVWCLYGKTIRKITAGEVVNNKAKDPCVVSMEMEIDEKQYVISRMRYKGKHGTQRLTIKLEGEDITPTEKPQILLDSLLGLDYDAFINVCVFAHNAQFRFIQLPNSKQKEIIESLIGFGDRFDKYLAVAKEKLSGVTERQVNEKEKKTRASERIRSLGEEKSRNEYDHSETEKHMQMVEQEEKGIETAEELRKKRAALTKKDKKLHLQLFDLQTEVGSMRGGVEVINKVIEISKRTLKGVEDALKQKICPFCMQKVDEKIVKKVRKESLVGIEEEQGRLEKAIRTLNKSVEEWKQTKKKYTNVQRKILELTDKLETKIGAGNREADEKMLKVFEARLEYIKGELEETKNTKFYCEQEMIKLEKLGDYYEFLQGAFSRDGIESYLFDSLLSFLNEKANYYASELSDGRISVNFATLKQTRATKELRDVFHVQVTAAEGGDSYGGCSSSEERFADLAVALAKRDLVEATGGFVLPILLLDEVGDALDPVGAKRLLTFLLEYAKNKSVWMISHDEDLKQHFDQCITVVREGGIAHVA